ncbi:MAG: ATP12 family chaperone protein [Marivivens sp.]
MSNWKPKRFWKEATVVEAQGGFTVLLDGRAVKTPAKAPLVVPTRAMAEAIAAEWQAQEKEVDPRTMPVTRSANAAIDKVTPQKAEVCQMLADYGGHDLLCYRAIGPQELVQRQASAWDPILSWCDQQLAAPLASGQGVMHVEQPAQSLARLAHEIERLDSFGIAALHDLVTISGSLVLALAVLHRHLDWQAAWALSRIDEEFQIEQWGHDEEAAAAALAKEWAFLNAALILEMLAFSKSREN